MPNKKIKPKSKLKKVKANQYRKIFIWVLILFTLFLITSLYLLLVSGSGPLKFLTANSSINRITSESGERSGKNSAKTNSYTNTKEQKSASDSTKDSPSGFNKPVEKPLDTPPTPNEKSREDMGEKPPVVTDTAVSDQADNNTSDKPAVIIDTRDVERTKDDGPVNTPTPTPTVVDTIVDNIKELVSNSDPASPEEKLPATTTDQIPTRAVTRTKDSGPLVAPPSTPITPPSEKNNSTQKSATIPTDSTPSIPVDAPPESSDDTPYLHAGDQCDESIFTKIPSCNNCKDQAKIENTLTDGSKITSCQRGEPSVDSLADAQTGFFIDKSKNDGKKCDATDPFASAYCEKVCKGRTYVLIGSQPSCGTRDIITEAKYCNGQPFHTWNSNLNECLLATPDINYTLTPFIDHGQETMYGYNVPNQPPTQPTSISLPSSSINLPTSLEKASIFNIFDKSQNTGKTCSAGSGLSSCSKLCANMGVIPQDDNGNYISDSNGFVFVCQ